MSVVHQQLTVSIPDTLAPQQLFGPDRASHGYLNHHEYVSWEHRAITVNWMFDVGEELGFTLAQEYCAVHFFDVVLEQRRHLPLSHVQLLATTCMALIEARETEWMVQRDSMEALLDCCDGLYSLQELKSDMVYAASYEIALDEPVLTAVDVALTLKHISGAQDEVWHLTRYLLEILVLTPVYLEFSNITLGTVAFAIACQEITGEIPAQHCQVAHFEACTQAVLEIQHHAFLTYNQYNGQAHSPFSKCPSAADRNESCVKIRSVYPSAVLQHLYN